MAGRAQGARAPGNAGGAPSRRGVRPRMFGRNSERRGPEGPRRSRRRPARRRAGDRPGYPAVDPGAPNCPVISFDGFTKLNDESGTVAKCDAVVYPYDGNSPVGTEWAFCWATTCLAIL